MNFNIYTWARNYTEVYTNELLIDFWWKSTPLSTQKANKLWVKGIMTLKTQNVCVYDQIENSFPDFGFLFVFI